MMDLQEKIETNTWDHVGSVLPVLDAASKGEWSWLNNFKCKYLEIRIDMRDGGCIIRDRNGNRINPEDLAHQLGGEDRIKSEGWPSANKTEL